MPLLSDEIKENFETSLTAYLSEIQTAEKKLSSEHDLFLASYFRIVSLQAWRSELLGKIIPNDSLDFFLEAQNDCISSHVLARIGMHRAALKALRSCIENTYWLLFYMDHPIELKLWLNNDHRIDRSEVELYLKKHPSISSLNDNAAVGLSELSNQYALLNAAVHASSKSFRMTGDIKDITVCSGDVVRVRKWATNERLVISSINMLLIAFFRDRISGTSVLNLRKVISHSLSSTQRQLARDLMKVIIPDPKST